MIRVLIVEDSVVQREILRRILESDPRFTIVAEGRNGREGVRLVEEHRPDVVLMDIHMPEMNGLEATRAIMERCPVPIVIASASLRKSEVDLGLEALNAGAVSVIAKPEGAVLLNLEKIAPLLREEVAAASRARLRPAAPPRARAEAVEPRPDVEGVQVVALCASTGGPAVLTEILTALPRPYPLPILIVQHITQGFEEGYAGWLTEKTGQPVTLAEDGQRLTPGVWLGPSGKHLTLASAYRIALKERGPEDFHCPSGDPLFESLARLPGARAAGVLLTGMGDDGARGLLRLKEAGGLTVIQDEASSFIWGMPKAGKQLNAATLELNPREIAALLTQIIRKGAEK